MKLIIDISDEEYNRIKEWEDNITGYQTSLTLYRAVRNSKPYEERPQGEWIDVNGDGSLWKCNNCGEKSCCKGNYCPDCGADMRGGAE